MATDTALLVSDMQVGNVGAAYRREAIVARRKRTYDAFSGTPLREDLAARGVRHLVVTGVQAERRVDATCRRAASEGFDVTLMADGHTTEDTPPSRRRRSSRTTTGPWGRRRTPTTRSSSGRAPRSPSDVLKSHRRVVFSHFLCQHRCC